MRKWIVLIILIVIGIIAYNYIYQDHRDIESETAVFVLNSTDLVNEFTINPSASEKKYLNKTIEVFGTITELNDQDLTLDNNIFCQFNSKIEVDTSKKVSIKGRFIGYDELLDQIKIDQCSIITNQK
jgi:hypothetical protein